MGVPALAARRQFSKTHSVTVYRVAGFAHISASTHTCSRRCMVHNYYMIAMTGASAGSRSVTTCCQALPVTHQQPRQLSGSIILQVAYIVEPLQLRLIKVIKYIPEV